MSILCVSSFYIPNVSSSIKISKRDLEDELQLADCDMEDYADIDFPLESRITDFWTLNFSYKKLTISVEIANIDNNELQEAIKTNLGHLYDLSFSDKMLGNKISYENMTKLLMKQLITKLKFK